MNGPAPGDQNPSGSGPPSSEEPIVDDLEDLIDAAEVRGHYHYFVHRGRWWACIVPSCTVRQIYPSRGTA